MKILSSFRSKFHKLHLGLYLIFAMMVYFGATTSTAFSKYSLIDTDLLKTEWQRISAERAKNSSYKPSNDITDTIFKKLNLKKKTNYIYGHGKWEKKVTYSDDPEIGGYYFLFLAFWLWPLYRYYFSKKKPDLARIERRIINLPLVLFTISWLIALQRYFTTVSAYSSQYGPAPDRVKLVMAVAAVVFGAFVSYLNIEITGPYIRRYIARPFFLDTNPYGIKRGLAINLTLRYALMLFSLAAFPLMLSLYMPAYANMDIWQTIKASHGSGWAWTISYEDMRALLPLIFTAALVGLMLIFQLVSLILYRYNVQVPLSALVKRMKAVAAGDFDCKTSVFYADELGQLKGHFNMMLDGLVERDHIKDTFGRYVSLEIADKIMKSGKVNLAGEEIQATVLFSDIRGFTPLSEKMPPPELIRFLNEYFTYITKPIAENKGVINKFIGDAVMAIFSPVFGIEDHREAAVRSALGMRKALAEFNALGKHPEVSFGVGLHSGGLIAGNVGTASRLEYTVLGDTVNVASRIETQTKTAATEILLSQNVLDGINKNNFPGVTFTECAPVIMKGKSKPMVLYKAEVA